MTTTVEYGYLGNASVETGGTISRLPTLLAGEPIFIPSAEGAWANELIAADGRFRYMKTARATGRGAGNALDAVLADNFTILCLNRPETNTPYASCLSKGAYGAGGTEWFGLYSMGAVNVGALFNVNHAGASSKAVMEYGTRKPGNWQWTACARSGGAMSMWSDGKKFTDNDLVTTPIGNTNLLVVDSGSYRVNIACVLIYNRVLTDQEMTDLILGDVTPKSLAGLVGYYKFNEVSGLVCTDYSGAGNHLTYQSEFSSIQEEWSPDGNLARAMAAGVTSWYIPTGCTATNAGFNFTTSAAAGSSFTATADIATGQYYTVSYDVSNISGGAGVRIMLFGANGASAATAIRYTNGTNITETIKVAGTGAGVLNKIGVQNLVANSTALISNVKVVPASGQVDGRGGQPYVTRAVRDPGAWWDVVAPRIASPTQACSLLTGLATTPMTAESVETRIGTKDLSICGWIKIQGVANKTVASWTLLHKSANTEYRFDVGTDGKTLALSRSGQGAQILLSRPIPYNKWVHIAVVQDYATTEAKFYINGVFVGSNVMTGTLNTAINGGIGIGSVGYPRVCQVRSVRLLFRKLTAQELTTIFQTDILEDTTDLIGEWLCNDPSIVYLKDSSGNGRHTAAFGTGSSIVLDSPYMPQRRKRKGKQLAVPGYSAININGTALPSLLHGQQTITLSGWVRCPLGSARTQRLNLVNASAGSKQIVSLSQNVYLSPQPMLSRAGVDPVVYAGAVYAPIANAEWHFWAIEFDCVNKTCSIYYDGIRIGSPTVGMTTTAGSGFDLTTDGTTMATQLRVCNPNSGTLVGSYVAYDDFRIHTRALTAAEHYQMFLTGEAPRDNLALEYLFDNDGTVAPQVVDSSGNGFHGTWQSLWPTNYVTQQ